jgi:hypothetical protein
MSNPGTPSPNNCAAGEQSSESSREPAFDMPAAGSSIKESRGGNRTHFPLLSLPSEILVHVLFLAMDDTKFTPAWRTVLPTCRYLCETILSTPKLWGRINCIPPENMFKRFEMAKWSPTEVYAHTFKKRGTEETKATLDRVRDSGLLHCHGIHTLEFSGETDMWARFSWIFDQPFPNLRHLSVRIAESPDIATPFTVSGGTRLETLLIDNIGIPAPSHLFHNLKNLHVGFLESSHELSLSVHQLITILNSSPHLETLSLRHIHPDVPSSDGGQSNRVVTLSRLNYLKLTDYAAEAAAVLDHLNLPAIDSLVLDLQGLKPSHLPLLFPNNVLANRLFKNAPNFPFKTKETRGMRMGGLRFPSRLPGEEILRLLHGMVPLSVTEVDAIKDRFDESHWREFARERPEVRLICSSYGAEYNKPNGMWRALLPNHDNRSATLFPKLDTVVLRAPHLSWIPRSALHCLRMRREAGFKLKRLEVQDAGKISHAGRQPEDFMSLADVFVYRKPLVKLEILLEP